MSSDWVRYGAVLAAAGIGAAVFDAAGLPAPWLSGSMLVAVALALAGVRFVTPNAMRDLAFLLLGCQIGSSITWATLSRFMLWPASLSCLALAIVAVVGGCAMFYTRAYGWDRPTAVLGSNPGAMSLTLATIEPSGADATRVTVVQCVRVFLLVALLPGLLSWAGAGDPAHPVAQQAASLNHLAIILAAGLAAGLAGRFSGLPAGIILGAAIGVATMQLGGIVEGQLPVYVLVPAFVILGVLIGSRFCGLAFPVLKQLSIAGLYGFLIAFALSLGLALLAVWMTGLPASLMILAFAPGGLEAMTIMAFALGLDPAFVAGHQLVRYVGLSLTLPMLVPWLRRGAASRTV